MRKHALALALVSTLVPLSAAASTRCPDEDRRQLLMVAKSGAVAPKGLEGCLSDLQADVAAIRRRMAVEAREQAKEEKKQQALAKLTAVLKQKLDASAPARELKVVVEQMEKAADEAGTPFGCADPERQVALIEDLRARLVSLRESLSGGSATCCDDRVTAGVKSVDAATKQIEAASECDGWALRIPGAASQLESNGPGDAPIDEYLLDAKGALNRLEKWLPADLECKDNDSNIEKVTRAIARQVELSEGEVRQKIATEAGQRNLMATLDQKLKSQPGQEKRRALEQAQSLLEAIAPKSEQDTEDKATSALRVAETACSAKGQLYALLRKRGLRPRLIGVLVPAVNFTRAGDDDGKTGGTAASAHVDLASRQWFPWRGPVGLGWVGRVGYRQVLHLVAPAVGEDGKPPSNQRVASDTAAQFDSAFVWDMGGKIGARLGSAGELSLAGRIGQSHFGGAAQVKEGENGAPATLVVPTDKSGAGVWYREVSARFVAFHDRTEHQVVAYELGVLRPMASIEYGLRWDDQLQPPTFESETDPEARERLLQTVTDRFGVQPKRRQFLRLSLQGVPVAGLDSKLFALSFAVEHEWHGRAKPGIAAGTKIYLQGTLHLANALKGM